MGMVLLDRFRVPTVGQVVKHHLDDFNVGVIHPRTPLFIEANVRHGVRLYYHGITLPESDWESRLHRTVELEGLFVRGVVSDRLMRHPAERSNEPQLRECRRVGCAFWLVEVYGERGSAGCKESAIPPVL